MTETKSDAVKSNIAQEPGFRSMDQDKLEVVKQEMERVNVDILGISELKWTGMGEFNSMTIISTTAGRNPSEEME